MLNLIKYKSSKENASLYDIATQGKSRLQSSLSLSLTQKSNYHWLSTTYTPGAILEALQSLFRKNPRNSPRDTGVISSYIGVAVPLPDGKVTPGGQVTEGAPEVKSRSAWLPRPVSVAQPPPC